jgi:glycosyl transferase family 25
LAQTPLGISKKWTLGDYAKPPIMAAAYALTTNAAKRLLKVTEKFGRPVDSEIQWWWETGVRFQALLPYPIQINAETNQTSSLRGKRGKKRKFYKIIKLKQQIEYYFQIYIRTILKFGLLSIFRAQRY